MSCISFKGTQYKEFKFVRELFKEMDKEFYPKSLVIPVSYTFHAHFEIIFPKIPQNLENTVNIDLSK